MAWLEAHDALAGWAQFAGAIFALLLTYFTAFAPTWRRKRQLENTAKRLLLNGFEVVESYHRTSAHFLPSPLSIRLATMSMGEVAGEIDRFPIFELDDQGSRSLARHLGATSLTLKGLVLILESSAVDLEGRDGTLEDQETIRELVGQRLDFLKAMLAGEELKRPEWPNA